jgi:glycolate oxidase FAD binding subunit
VLTEIVFRVFPRPPRVGALVLLDCSPDAGLRALRKAAALAVEPTGLTYLPSQALDRLNESPKPSRGQAFIRVEGSADALAEKFAYLKEQFREFEHAVIGSEETARLFRLIGNGEIFAASDSDLWRLCVPPVAAPVAIAEAGAALWYADRGGGLIWLQMPATAESAQTLRRITAELTGHASLFRASREARGMISVFEPESSVKARLTRNVKQAFDPHCLFNPGRMFEYL